MGKQLTMYEQLSDPAPRDVWRQNATKTKDIYRVEVKQIKVLPGWNARTEFDHIEELAEDIASNGLIVPLEGIMNKAGKFILTDGERRFRAIQLANERGLDMNEIEVVVHPKMSPSDMLIRMISGGIHKSKYKPIEVANALMRLKTDFELSNDEIAKRVGMSRQWVDNQIKLAKQPEDVKSQVASGEVKKTAVIAPMKDKVTDVAAGMIKPIPQPGIPDNRIRENRGPELPKSDIDKSANTPLPQRAATEVSKSDALQGVNYDKVNNEMEECVNRMMKTVNRIEKLGKGLNEQGAKDLDTYLGWLRKDLEIQKIYYAKFKNKAVV